MINSITYSKVARPQTLLRMQLMMLRKRNLTLEMRLKVWRRLKVMSLRRTSLLNALVRTSAL
jgi:hypothetical protein